MRDMARSGSLRGCCCWLASWFVVAARSHGPIDPDAGIVIDWENLDKIVASYNETPQEAWLPPPSPNCSCVKLEYRALYCPWYLKPFRDPFDLVVTETKKWSVSRKLLGCEDDVLMLNGPLHTGMPMMAYFGTECCRVFQNTTQAFQALSAFDLCWAEHNELQSCFAEGRLVRQNRTALSAEQYRELVRNASYADAATPHLAAVRSTAGSMPKSDSESILV